MLRNPSAIALGLLLVAAPVSVTLADDEETQTLHNNTFQESGTDTCNGSGLAICYVRFAPTTHTTTVIKAISCDTNVPSGSPVYASTLFAVKAAEPFNEAVFNVPVTNLSTSNGYDARIINAQVNLFIEKGATPIFRLSTTQTRDGIRCTISGYHS